MQSALYQFETKDYFGSIRYEIKNAQTRIKRGVDRELKEGVARTDTDGGSICQPLEY